MSEKMLSKLQVFFLNISSSMYLFIIYSKIDNTTGTEIEDTVGTRPF